MGTPTQVCVWSCPNFSAPAGRPFRCVSDIWLLISGDAKIMPPKIRTRSAGRPAAESLGGGTGVRVGRGGRGRRPRECNDERVDDLNGQGNNQGLRANGGVEGVNGNVCFKTMVISSYESDVLEIKVIQLLRGFSKDNLSNVFNLCIYPSVSVGDDYSILVTNSGHSVFHTLHRPLHLNNVLFTPNIVKNLIYVRQFVRDMYCTVEFDAFGFSVKDFLTRQVLLRCDSTRNLYPVTKPSAIPHAFLTSQYIWHQRLGHSGSEVLRRILFSNSISCN
ncbi:hypothetical protein Tco_0800095 [Tanacetum coccineum]|uniref:Uncharacterized protein n=1 Tax=Tanacetum coccineum TaxID=301880 RepID=A0ABQ4ZVF1_9ASTR